MKKGTEEVATKDLDQLFKAMALHIDDDKLKDWADEMDEDGKTYTLALTNRLNKMFLHYGNVHIYALIN